MPDDEPSAASKPAEPSYKKTRDHLDWIKWLAGTVLALVAAGWGAHSYVTQFQTTEQANVAQMQNNSAHQELQHELTKQAGQLDGLEDDIELYSLRLELQQRNASDRLDLLLAREDADSYAERQALQAEERQTALRIQRRARILNSPRALKRLSVQLRDDPVAAFEGL